MNLKRFADNTFPIRPATSGGILHCTVYSLYDADIVYTNNHTKASKSGKTINVFKCVRPVKYRPCLSLSRPFI